MGIEGLLVRRSDMNLETSTFLDGDSLSKNKRIYWVFVGIPDAIYLNIKQIDLFRLLSDFSKMRVLVLCHHNNCISISDYQEISVSKSNDMMSAIVRS